MERCSLRSLKATQTGVGCCLPQVGGFGSHVSSLDSVRFARLTVKGRTGASLELLEENARCKRKISPNLCQLLFNIGASTSSAVRGGSQRCSESTKSHYLEKEMVVGGLKC